MKHESHKNELTQLRVDDVVQGDCLEVLARRASTLPLDMVYIDPPYFSKRDYEGVLRESTSGEVLKFSDRWGGRGGDRNAELSAEATAREIYLSWLRERVVAIAKVLKPGGAFVLHLDWHVVHYAKVMCDEIFGEEQFVNELIWHYQTGGASKSHFSRKHDTIWWYAKAGAGGGGGYFFDGGAIAIPRTAKSMKRAKCPTGARIKVTDTHKNPDDVLMVPALNPMSNERTGYPTQKPLELLEKLVVALCPPGGLVGDFFCGSGTTLVAAKRLGRKYVGCDVSSDAVELAKKRLAGVEKILNSEF